MALVRILPTAAPARPPRAASRGTAPRRNGRQGRRMAPREDRSTARPASAPQESRNHAEAAERTRRARANDPPGAPQPGPGARGRAAHDGGGAPRTRPTSTGRPKRRPGPRKTTQDHPRMNVDEGDDLMAGGHEQRGGRERGLAVAADNDDARRAVTVTRRSPDRPRPCAERGTRRAPRTGGTRTRGTRGALLRCVTRRRAVTWPRP